MDSLELWERYKSWLTDLPEIGFRLDVSRMGLTEAWVSGMESRMQGAFDAMEALEAGGIANPDEGRQVGHYWLRAPELAPDAGTGTAIRETLEGLLEFTGDVHAGRIAPPGGGRFDRMLVVGIGGSALGPQFVADALGGSADRMRVGFLDNTDPDGIDRVLESIGDKLGNTLTVVISKSGGTPETRNGMLETEAAYRKRDLAFGPHAVAITGEGSRLDRFAEERGFLARFPMWDWVGGRTSVMCAVGLLPAALQGIDVRGLLDGAAAMDRVTRRRTTRGNPAAMLALAWHHAGEGRGARDMVVLPYKDRLALFSRYLQQLVMESLGKEKDLAGEVVHQGISVYGNKGSTDQHAYVQQLRDGVPNFFVTFVEVLRGREGASLEVDEGATAGDFLHGFLLGTRRALFDNGRASMTISVDRVGPASVGGLIALYERAVGLYASLIGVNAYHQPGVEAGKKAAASVLDLQRRVRARLAERESGATVEQLAAEVGAPGEVETVFHLLERLSANPDSGVSRSAGATPFEALYSSR